MIYLDNAATTKAFRHAAEKALYYSCEEFYNPSAGYSVAQKVSRDINNAAEAISKILCCGADELVFTSGATESNNTVFERAIKTKQGNIVVSSMEHPSVYECAKKLAGTGVDVRFIKILPDGTIDENDFSNKIDDKTILVSIMHVSNETGVVNDIAKLCAITKQKAPKSLFHSDGVQAFCKIPVNLKRLGVDLYSISAHKIGGVKGIGALYIKDGISIAPFILGGGQQGGRRAGTDNAGGIIAFASAAEEYQNLAKDFIAHKLREYIISETEKRQDILVNGKTAPSSGYIVSLSFNHIRGETLARTAQDRGIIAGLGSACSTHIKTNRVLAEMKLPKSYLEGSIRISFSPLTTLDDVKEAVKVLFEESEKLRRKLLNG